MELLGQIYQLKMDEKKLLGILDTEIAKMWRLGIKQGLSKALNIEGFLNLYKSEFPQLTKKYYKEITDYKNYIFSLKK